MERSVVYSLLLTCFTSLVAGDGWTNPNGPYYELADKRNPAFVYNDGDGQTHILEDSGGDGDGLYIWKINYDGEIPADRLSVNDPTGRTNIFNLRYEDNVNYLWFASSSDFDALSVGEANTYTLKIMDQSRLFIYLDNKDDNPPAISRATGATDCRVTENNKADATECTFVIEDVDGCADNVEIEISGTGVPAGRFEMRFNTTPDHYPECLTKGGGDPGQLRKSVTANLAVREPLDYEEVPSYYLTLTIKDGADHSGGAGLPFLLYVDDAPDQIPVWQTLISTKTITEKTEDSFSLRAVDGDRSINAEINYKMSVSTSGSDVMDPSEGNLFQIDHSSGMVSIAAIDRDKYNHNTYALNIIAYERDNETSAADPITVTIFVTDVNDNSPSCLVVDGDGTSCEQYPNQKIPEGTAGTFSKKFNITDPDEGDGGWFDLVITIDGNVANELFTIIPTSAYQSGTFQIQYVALDYEETTSYDIQIKITERADVSHVISVPIHVDVDDVNDNFPEFEKETSDPVPVEENTEKGTSLMTIKATDKDHDATLTYFTNSKDFSVDPITGLIILLTENFFDYERQQVVQIQVYATDVAHNVTATITFQVSDINDAQPTVASNSSRVEVEENKAETTTNLVVTAADQDTDADLSVQIVWTASTATKDNIPLDITTSGIDKWFTLIPFEEQKSSNSPAKFLIFVQEKPKWDVADSVQLNVVAIDKNTANGYMDTSIPVVVSIQIINVDDHSPKITNCDGTFHMKEESDEDAKIGLITAEDLDGSKSTIKFRILTQPLEGTVKIDDSTGLLTTGPTKYDADTMDEKYILTVAVTDNVNNETSCEITITVDDINDNTPYAAPVTDGFTISINETIDTGEVLFDIKGRDLDKTENFKTMYWNLADDYNYFSLTADPDDYTKATLRVSYTDKGFDYDDPNSMKSYPITVIVCNNITEANGKRLCNESLILTVNIMNVNDNDPIFPESTDPEKCVVLVAETTAVSGILALTPTWATDKDGDDLTYEILSVKCNSAWSKICSDDSTSLSLFYINKTNENGYSVFAAVELLEHYGHYVVNLQATDIGGRTGNTNVTFCITDVNSNEPVFEPPYSDDNLELRIVNVDGHLALYEDRQRLSNIIVTDNDWEDNGRVDFTITTTPVGMFSSDIIQGVDNQISLKTTVTFNDLSESILVTVVAKDRGIPPKNKSTSFKILRIITDEREPEFNNSVYSVIFKENSTDVKTDQLPTAVDPNNVNVPAENQTTIFYFLTDGDSSTFSVSDSGVLSLNTILDASVKNSYVLEVRASNSQKPPEDSPGPKSLLTVNISVEDINDKWPEFIKKDLTFAVTNLDNDKVMAQVQATDKDAGDVVTYSIVEDSIKIKLTPDVVPPSNLLKVDPDRGDIYVQYPQNVISGNISFDIVASDTEKHPDTAHCLVYLVSDIYLMTFSFNNSRVSVEENKNEIAKITTSYFQHTCVPHQAREWGNYANLSVYFQGDNFEPLDPNTGDIKLARDNLNLMQNLSIELSKMDFKLIGAGNDESIPTEDDLTTALIVVSAVLLALFVALLGLYFFKTRRLSEMVKRLTRANATVADTKATALPNTNNFKEEFSNPVWNTEHRVGDLDTISTTSSDDSGLVGIEDNPEFQEFYNKIVLKEQQGGDPPAAEAPGTEENRQFQELAAGFSMDF